MARPVRRRAALSWAMREFHDLAFRRWFDHRRMVEDLLRGFAPPGVAPRLDFASLEQMPADYVDDDLRASRGDALWRVRYRGDGEREWLYLLVLLEFQSTVDPFMAARVLAYTAQTYVKLIRAEAVKPGGGLPPVLPVVIYNGRTRWSAAEDTGGLIAAADGALAPFQPRQRYLLLDEHALRVEDLPEGNAVSAQIALERGSRSDMAPALRDLDRLLAGPEHESLRRAFAEWVRRTVERSRAASENPGLAGTLRMLEEAGDLGAMGSLLAESIDAHYDALMARARAEGVERGMAQERALLARQAARKFGAATAARLAALLEGVSDPARLEEVGESVIDCADGADLLARLEASSGPD